ncbi:hypothetical protein IRY31_03375 [Corynebacterium afermentans subsp. lipophilum]|uniref:hypothetical protein n=1 Tax=Corynebacterium afermentans TaxID=38286 RepID=UPI00188C92D9|nr:hypothetical protein [Corynebacterium afermentans]MBF4547126.1 hypothetical protein [Corynebacterium afermentans subsp. lipophilum]WJY59489.1 hypothetical protein CAFEL_08685 [Corynebacterium afermentans subsp. lipophilum]
MADINRDDVSAGTTDEVDKLLDASTTRIGNAPTNFNSVDDFENAEDETLKSGSGHKDEHPNTEERTDQVERTVRDGE